MFLIAPQIDLILNEFSELRAQILEGLGKYMSNRFQIREWQGLHTLG